MPTCRDMSELVTDYLERAVSLRARLDMWWHLCRCEACRRYYDQMRRTVRLLRQPSASRRRTEMPRKASWPPSAENNRAICDDCTVRQAESAEHCGRPPTTSRAHAAGQPRTRAVRVRDEHDRTRINAMLEIQV